MKTALVLDDQGAYVRALVRSLRGELEITGAETIAAARAALQPGMVVALVDICLSTTDAANREGLEFIHWLRSERPDIRIIAMSAQDEPDIPEQAKMAGADVFLSKPLRISELKAELARLTGDGP